MKTSTFKSFIEVLGEAKENDAIWSAGYLFIDVTEKQAVTLIDTLTKNPCCKMENGYIFTPAGIGFKLN